MERRGLNDKQWVFKRFSDRVKTGIWQKRFDAVSGQPDMEYAMADAVIVKVHRHGQGAKGVKPSHRPLTQRRESQDMGLVRCARQSAQVRSDLIENFLGKLKEFKRIAMRSKSDQRAGGFGFASLFAICLRAGFGQVFRAGLRWLVSCWPRHLRRFRARRPCCRLSCGRPRRLWCPGLRRWRRWIGNAPVFRPA